MEASEQDRGAASPDLTPDVATTQGPIDKSDAVALGGLLGTGCSDEYVRLYENVALNRWLEIPKAAIINRFATEATAGGDDVTAGQSVIWVRRDAVLARCESVRASSYGGPPESDGATLRRWPRP